MLRIPIPDTIQPSKFEKRIDMVKNTAVYTFLHATFLRDPTHPQGRKPMPCVRPTSMALLFYLFIVFIKCLSLR
jgi:hypothetical protein